MELINGNCLEVLKNFESNSIDAIVTDPPYGLSFMGKKWDYDVPSQEIWEECLRVLKPGGYLLAFAGTRTQHRMAVRIEDAGFEIRDMIAWVYGSGFPKSRNIGLDFDKRNGVTKNRGKAFVVAGQSGQRDKDTGGDLVPGSNTMGAYIAQNEWNGWGTALKPALEPITVARKPLEKGLNVAQNCLKWGVGGINIDGCRVGTEELGGGTMPDLRDVGAMSKEAIGIDKLSCGQNSRPALRKEQPTYTGRFPANLVHDGSDEVVGLFPNTKTNSTGKNSPADYNTKSVFGAGYKSGALPYGGDSGSAARFFYCAKASKSERNRGCEDMEDVNWWELNDGGGKELWKGQEDYRQGKKYQNHPSKNFHPTVKPIALMEYLVKLVSKEGHTVLDPFMGSGSTGIACKKLNRNFIGIELDADYCKIAEARINAVKSIQNNLF